MVNREFEKNIVILSVIQMIEKKKRLPKLKTEKKFFTRNINNIFYNYDLYTSIAFYKKLEIYDNKLLFGVMDNLIQKGLNLKEYENVFIRTT